MNGIFLIIPNLCPFVPSTNSRRALSLSKDSERFFQQPVRASKDFCQYLKVCLRAVPLLLQESPIQTIHSTHS
jgi:hypothetical protein